MLSSRLEDVQAIQGFMEEVAVEDLVLEEAKEEAMVITIEMETWVIQVIKIRVKFSAITAKILGISQ